MRQRLAIDNQSFWGAAIGTMLEYYDNGLFVIFLPFLAPLFFAGRNIYDDMMYGYIVLFLACLARPLGGLFFGYIGDRFGRKKSLLLTIYGIAIATFIMGILPNHHQIGWLATVFLLLCKMVQYFCFGGEYSGAGIYVVELAPKHYESYWSSLLTANTVLGTLLAALFGMFLTETEMPSSAWRLAFIMGGLLGLFASYYRRHMHESPQFKRVPQSKDWASLFRNFSWQMITAMMVGAIATIPFYMVIGFINPLLMFQNIITHGQLMLMQTLLSSIAVVTLIISGQFNLQPSKQMRFSVLIILILTPLLLFTFDHHDIIVLFILEGLVIIANETFLGPANAYLKTLFPMYYRYRGTAIGFAFGSAIFGAITPLLADEIYHWSSHFILLTLWIVLICTFTLALLYRVKAKF